MKNIPWARIPIFSENVDATLINIALFTQTERHRSFLGFCGKRKGNLKTSAGAHHQNARHNIQNISLT